MRVEELIGAEPQICEDCISAKSIPQLCDNILQFCKVGVEQAHAAGGIGEPRLRELEVARIDVESDKQAIGSKEFRDRAGVTCSAESAIDNGLPLRDCKFPQNFIEQDGSVASFWEVHGLNR